ncbi:hypothetical protein CLOM_g24308 [Closterium sp. NIES-68]|nr:hypothetical protein CLOM_g24308 [Closterium sp. NIES-68]
MMSLPPARSSVGGGGGKVVLVGVRLHQPNANLLWSGSGGGGSSNRGGSAAVSKEGQALVEFALSRLVVPGDRIIAMAVRIVRAPHSSGSRKARFNSEQDAEEEEEMSQKMLAALHPKIEVAGAKQILLQVVVRSSPRVRDALLHEAKVVQAGMVVIGPVRRTITLIGGSGGADVDMMTFLADRLPTICKIMLVANNACTATRQGMQTPSAPHIAPFPPNRTRGRGRGNGAGARGIWRGVRRGRSNGGSNDRGSTSFSLSSSRRSKRRSRRRSSSSSRGEGGILGRWGRWGGGESGGWQQCPRSPRSQVNGQDFFSAPPVLPPAPPTEIIREVYGQDEYGQQEFFLDELLLATDNFSPQRLIGEGGSGQVFVGVLPPGRCPQVENQGERGGGGGGGASGGCRKVAVKRLRWWGPAVADAQGAMNARQFLAELRVLRRIQHVNLLGLLGVCATAGELLMVFDFLPNGSLETRLRDQTKPPLPWDLRMRIAYEAATGLAFLHSCRPPIIHRDVKAANVLLDADMHALVSDFGLAKVGSDQYTQPMAVTSIMGTRGYVAPEYVQTGLITAAIDVYAFGVILLELITGHVPFHPGRQPPNLSAWAVPIAKNEEFTRLVDYRLEGRFDPGQLQAGAMLAVLCLATNPKDRPSMQQVATWLRDWIKCRSTEQLP